MELLEYYPEDKIECIEIWKRHPNGYLYKIIKVEDKYFCTETHYKELPFVITDFRNLTV